MITVPPTNQTKLEGEKVQFSCEAKALPGNVTVRWFREGAPVTEVSALDTRVTIKADGSLVINPVSADDSGQYLCEVTNGIGDPQSANAYLNVECEFPTNLVGRRDSARFASEDLRIEYDITFDSNDSVTLELPRI